MSRAKVVLVGDSSVGKTSIAQCYISKSFQGDSAPTIGASNIEITVPLSDEQSVTFDLWDTAGQERYRSLGPMYYQRSNAAILVYDTTSRRSFTELENFYVMLQQKAPADCAFFVVGNKYDLVSERDVSYEEGEKFSKQIKAVYFGESSALTHYGIEELFKAVADSLVNFKGHDDGSLIVEKTEDKSSSSGCC